MLLLIITSLFLFPLFKSGNCSFSNIDIEPKSVILNSTSTTKFICAKKTNDYRGFDVILSRHIPLEYIQIFINRFNDTTIEIIVESFDYIGAFQLICSSKGEIDAGTQSDLKIGKPPGLIMRAKRCVVYYDEYIDCTIRAPIVVAAIENGLRWFFHFIERGAYLQPKFYEQQPKLVKTDNVDETLTFRWYPRDVGHFPDGVKMVVYGTIRDFGTSNHTMDMTPTFRISSKFTVQKISSTDLRIEFNHGIFSSISFCHGNLTKDDDRIQSLNQRENMRTFDESNQTIIRVTSLRPDTWYKICFHCRRDPSIDTISDIECNRYMTFKTPISRRDITIVTIILCLVLFISAVLLLKICNRHRIQQQFSQGGHYEEIYNPIRTHSARSQSIPQNHPI